MPMTIKAQSMPDVKLQQLRDENEASMRLLNFLLDENVHLKHRLANILKFRSDPAFLEHAEDFQSRFVKKDMLLSLLRHDVVDFDTCLNQKKLLNGNLEPEVKQQLKKIRHNVAQMERQFNKLKQDFNTYVSEEI